MEAGHGPYLRVIISQLVFLNTTGGLQHHEWREIKDRPDFLEQFDLGEGDHG